MMTRADAMQDNLLRTLHRSSRNPFSGHSLLLLDCVRTLKRQDYESCYAFLFCDSYEARSPQRVMMHDVCNRWCQMTICHGKALVAPRYHLMARTNCLDCLNVLIQGRLVWPGLGSCGNGVP